MSDESEKVFGNRGKGRKPGSKNRNKYEVAERLKVLGFDVLSEMVQLYRDPDTKSETKAKMAGDLLKYVAPQLKAVEHSGDEDNPVALKIVWAGDVDDNLEEEDEDEGSDPEGSE